MITRRRNPFSQLHHLLDDLLTGVDTYRYGPSCPSHGTPRPTTARRCRRAFTLVEMLAVVSIIGLLVALILPAVQAAREAARRSRCVANLKQIGIALSAYETVHRVFPSSPLMDRWGVASSGLAEPAFILPQLEQSALYNSINTYIHEAVDYPSIENRTARNTHLENFLCPSDGDGTHLNSYRYNRGRFRVSSKSGLPFDGPFSLGVLPTPAKVTDGLSRTAFVSERFAGSFRQPGGPLRDLKAWAGYPGVIRSDADFIPLCLAATSHVEWKVVSGRYWMLESFTDTHYNHNGLPNDPRPSCTAESRVLYSLLGFHPPRSFHPGVVNVLMGDGHVEAVANAISFPVWTALGTYNLGDL
jgi:prepilin-type N-terminal cleavage/methylation domain-containing protein/prepilin-type processing-associated H-X9-DG protein